MHRALLLPKIVAAIVNSESSETGYLHTCLFINRLFFKETCRVLWYGCGSRYNSATASHVTPDIGQLAKISHRSRQRAQIYANFINILQFDQPKETWPYGDDALWHEYLVYLQYPQLQEVGFFGSYDTQALNKGDVVIHYAQQPSLRVFKLHRGSELSDAFLDQLRTRCPKLQHLELCSNPCDITEDGLLRFLRSFTTLKSLTLENGFHDLWTRAAFSIVGQYTDLELFEFSIVHDDWIQCDEEPMFPALKHFCTVISPNGVTLLSRLVPNLTTLSVCVPSCTSIANIANYPRLKVLILNLIWGSSFKAEDLLLIAQNCPDIERITVANDPGVGRVDGLDDAMMDRIASRLPNIKELKLLHVQLNRPPLTLASIKSLGRYCPKLKELSLSHVSIDWEGAGLVSDSIWSLHLGLSLDHNRLWPDDHDPDDGSGDHASRGQVKELAATFARRFPNMKYFGLDNGGPGERELNDRVGDFISGRDYFR